MAEHRPLLPRVAARIAEESAASGAQPMLVYLPARAAYMQRGLNPLRPVALAAAAAAGIEVLDVHPLFAAEPDPFALFSAPHEWSHLTPDGNRVVADAVLAEIERRGWLASPR